jgi:raffinose/stachyose/melibiose transport system permease protein
MNKKHDFLVALLFILPALIIYLFYFILPIPTSAYYSFFQWNGISPTMKFLGFGNWVTLFKDQAFWKALTNNITLVIASMSSNCLSV